MVVVQRYPCNKALSLLRRYSSSGKYRGTSLIRKRLPLGPYDRHLRRALWRSGGWGAFLMSEVALYSADIPQVASRIVRSYWRSYIDPETCRGSGTGVTRK